MNGGRHPLSWDFVVRKNRRKKNGFVARIVTRAIHHFHTHTQSTPRRIVFAARFGLTLPLFCVKFVAHFSSPLPSLSSTHRTTALCSLAHVSFGSGRNTDLCHGSNECQKVCPRREETAQSHSTPLSTTHCPIIQPIFSRVFIINPYFHLFYVRILDYR